MVFDCSLAHALCCEVKWVNFDHRKEKKKKKNPSFSSLLNFESQTILKISADKITISTWTTLTLKKVLHMTKETWE